MKIKQNVTKKELVSVFKIYILGWLCYCIAAILTLTLNFHLNFIIDIDNWCQNLCVLTMYAFMATTILVMGNFLCYLCQENTTNERICGAE